MIRAYLILIFISTTLSVLGQNDTIVLKNTKSIYGEIKKIQSNVLTIETSYSDTDFKIDFKEVSQLKIEKLCFVLLTKGRRRTGYVSSKKANYFTVVSKDQIAEEFLMSELLSLDEISEKFWGRFKGNIDLSFNHTKANNASQFVIESALGYKDLKWVSNASLSTLNSRQDETDDIERTEIKADIRRILPKKWYLIGNLGFLSNTEQAIKSRYSISTGIGRYLLFTNKLSLGVNFGINFNIEKFDDATTNSSSSELYFGSEFDMYDFKDFKLITSLNLYLSTDGFQRFRSDYNITLQYDLPLNLYLKAGYKFNYDSQAAVTGSDFDYLFTTGMGWSFN